MNNVTNNPSVGDDLVQESAPLKPLLCAEDPPAVTVRNAQALKRAMIVCDHASNRVPESLDGLGVDPATLERHVAYDIGAAGVAEHLSDALEIPAVFAGYSRLVIDINRPLEDFTSVREIYDGDIIPANRFLSSADMAARANELFHPYQNAVTHEVARIRETGADPAVIAVHSFTEDYRGEDRPWHIGVLSGHDRRMADPIIEGIKARRPDLVIGDNLPYSGYDAYGYTVETHFYPHGFANVLFEIRQDMIRDAAGQSEFGSLLAEVLAEVLEDESLYNALLDHESAQGHVGS